MKSLLSIDYFIFVCRASEKGFFFVLISEELKCFQIFEKLRGVTFTKLKISKIKMSAALKFGRQMCEAGIFVWYSKNSKHVHIYHVLS